MATYLPYADNEGWRGLVREDWADFAAGHTGLCGWLDAQPGRRVVSHASRTVDRLETARGVIFAKHFLSGSDRNSLWSRIKWILRPSRAIHLVKIGEELEAAGFTVPENVLAVRRRSALGWPEDIHLSVECPMQTVRFRLRDLKLAGHGPSSDEVRTLLQWSAANLVRLHRQGFVHGDCLPCNFCADQDFMLLLDNDRTTGGHGPRFSRAKRRNLEQCARYLAFSLGSPENARHFLACYAAADEWTPTQTAARLAIIEKRIRLS